MIVRRKGGMTEFIPSPQEKREALIRDHVLKLVENLHRRIDRLEREAGLPHEQAEAFAFLFKRIQTDENQNKELHNGLITNGSLDT